MQVALALRVNGIWLAFDIYSCWFLSNCAQNAWLPKQFAAKIIWTYFILNEWSARMLS